MWCVGDPFDTLTLLFASGWGTHQPATAPMNLQYIEGRIAEERRLMALLNHSFSQTAAHDERDQLDGRMKECQASIENLQEIEDMLHICFNTHAWPRERSKTFDSADIHVHINGPQKMWHCGSDAPREQDLADNDDLLEPETEALTAGRRSSEEERHTPEGEVGIETGKAGGGREAWWRLTEKKNGSLPKSFADFAKERTKEKGD